MEAFMARERDKDMTKRIHVTDDLHQALSIAKAKGGYRSLNNTIEDNLELEDTK